MSENKPQQEIVLENAVPNIDELRKTNLVWIGKGTGHVMKVPYSRGGKRISAEEVARRAAEKKFKKEAREKLRADKLAQKAAEKKVREQNREKREAEKLVELQEKQKKSELREVERQQKIKEQIVALQSKIKE